MSRRQDKLYIEKYIEKPKDNLSVSFLLATVGIAGMVVTNRITGMINASPDFYGLYDMNTGEVFLFLTGICLVLPSLLGLVAYVLAQIPSMRAVLAVYFIALSAITLTGLVREWPALAGGWLLVVLSVVLAFAGYLAFTRMEIVRVFLMATVLGLPVTLYSSLQAVGERIYTSDTTNKPVSTRVDPEKRLPDIVFLVLDELPLSTLLNAQGEIHAARFPNLSALVRNAYWFSNAGAVSCNTPTAVPAILTGQLFGSPAPESRAPNYHSYPQNLFTLLDGHYALHVVENLTQMCPNEICGRQGPAFYANMAFFEHIAVAWLHASLPESIEKTLPDLDPYWMEAVARTESLNHKERFSIRVKQLEDFVDAIKLPQAKPQLYFGHFLLPHAPFDLLPDGSTYFEGYATYAITGKQWDADQGPHVLQSYFRHILQARYVDRMVGQVVAKLKASGRYDETMLVIVADHGVSFVPGDTRRITNAENFANLIGVPLIVKVPGQVRGTKIDAPAQTVDVLPTLLGQVGLRPETTHFDGRDLFDPKNPPLRKRSHYCSNPGYDSYAIDLERPMREQVAIRDGIFGAHEDATLDMGFSTRPEWIGKTLPTLGTIEPSGRVARLAQVLGGDQADFVPLNLNGSIMGNAPLGSNDLLLVATLNGKVAAVMPPVRHKSGKTGIISLMLQPDFLDIGSNTIALYAVDRAQSGPPRFMALTIMDAETRKSADSIRFSYVKR